MVLANVQQYLVMNFVEINAFHVAFHTYSTWLVYPPTSCHHCFVLYWVSFATIAYFMSSDNRHNWLELKPGYLHANSIKDYCVWCSVWSMKRTTSGISRFRALDGVISQGIKAVDIYTPTRARDAWSMVIWLRQEINEYVRSPPHLRGWYVSKGLMNP